jgi:uroporphyrinogen III methyltransferase/synthase
MAGAGTGRPVDADPGVEIDWVSPLVVTPRFADTKRALGRLAEFRTIALTSVHAVDAMVGGLRALGHDVRALFGVRLAAVGGATAARLQSHGLDADLVAEGGGAELAAEIIAAQLPDAILHLRALDGRAELGDALVAAGKRVEIVAAYETSPDTHALKAARLRHAAEPYAAIGLSSPRGGTALVDAFGGAQRLAGLRIGAIGKTTQAALKAIGVDSVVPDHPSLDALVRLLSAPDHNG